MCIRDRYEITGVVGKGTDGNGTNNTAAKFAIDGESGVVRLVDALDYETDRSHVITVKATSSDGKTATATLTLGVQDVNVAPVLSDITVTKSEDIADTVEIANFKDATTSTDLDPDGTQLTYSLKNASTVFELMHQPVL